MTNYDYVFNRHSGNLRPVQWIEVPITRAYYQPNRKIVTHQELANAIRFLSIDAIEKAGSGHPGLPMGMADVATVLFQHFLKFYPPDPQWPNRDRFVLSAGHGSMLLYSLLYLTGYCDISIEDIKAFRTLHSKTPGHPEHGVLAGVETTTGPLGQGLANAVGMAMAQQYKSRRYGYDIVDHFIYAIVGDGDLMEGISHEAASFAGHHQLGKLIVLFDDNQVTIDGPTHLSCSEDHLNRFKAYNWHTIQVDGHNPKMIARAIEQARSCTDRPSFIACRTIIGYGSPNKQGTCHAHGSPLGAQEVEETRKQLKWTADPFEIPKPILDTWRDIGLRHQGAYLDWKEKTPVAMQQQLTTITGQQQVDRDLCEYTAQLFSNTGNHRSKTKATRQSFGDMLPIIQKHLSHLGGSADLTPSNNTKTSSSTVLDTKKLPGNYIHYGIREHAMAAMMNGIALHQGILPYGGTFLVFSDYLRPALRLSALMGLPVLYILTHDSIVLGEDGPTHQPIEHLASLRAIPNLLVMRPADEIEVAECLSLAVQQTCRPTILALSRQATPLLRTTLSPINLSSLGGYVISYTNKCDITLIATGTEVELALRTKDLLEEMGKKTTVVSMPCCELFNEQPKKYQDEVLGEARRVVIEAASSMGWHRYLRLGDSLVTIDCFGASGAAQEVYRHFGFTPQMIVEKIMGEV